jgi:peroxiredoxin Q/BCP
MGLRVGEKIPEFTLSDQHGNTFNSADYAGKKPMVIFFYPKDNTPGCTKEACSFRDSYEEFTDRGAEVVGISADTETSHRKFAASYELPFKLLADRKNKVRKLFKVEKALLNLLPGRETFVVDKEGFVVMAFNNIGASGHVKRALKALKSIS